MQVILESMDDNLGVSFGVLSEELVLFPFRVVGINDLDFNTKSLGSIALRSNYCRARAQ